MAANRHDAASRPGQSGGSLGRLRAWRLERAELHLADLRWYDQKWVSGWRLGVKPSEIASMKRQIDRAERKVERLGGAS